VISPYNLAITPMSSFGSDCEIIVNYVDQKIDSSPPLFTLLQPEMPTDQCDRPLILKLRQAFTLGYPFFLHNWCCRSKALEHAGLIVNWAGIDYRSSR
jgi:hypothetical protein